MRFRSFYVVILIVVSGMLVACDRTKSHRIYYLIGDPDYQSARNYLSLHFSHPMSAEGGVYRVKHGDADAFDIPFRFDRNDIYHDEGEVTIRSDGEVSLELSNGEVVRGAKAYSASCRYEEPEKGDRVFEYLASQDLGQVPYVLMCSRAGVFWDGKKISYFASRLRGDWRTMIVPE